MRIYWLIILSLCFTPLKQIQAQFKYEIEKKVKKAAVPTRALNWFDQKISDGKWYQEMSQQGKSFEYKVKHHGKKWSIEFDELGAFKDAELTVSWRKMPDSLKQKVCNALIHVIDQKFNVDKVQWQWVNSDMAKNNIYAGKPKTDFDLYELIVKVASKNGPVIYEIQIDSSGEVVQKLQQVHRSSDNLDF